MLPCPICCGWQAVWQPKENQLTCDLCHGAYKEQEPETPLCPLLGH